MDKLSCVALFAIGAVNGACHPAIVLARTVSLELNGGVTSVDGDPGAAMARSGIAWHLGGALNFEFQASESLRIGVGAGYTRVMLPAAASIESHTVASALAHLWFDIRLKSSERGGGSFTPRLQLGGMTGGDGKMTMGYLSLGGVFPQSHTWAVHVTTGPHWLAVNDFETKGHSGWGWSARIRIRRPWFDCTTETEGTCD